jgi:hypothetical protein
MTNSQFSEKTTTCVAIEEGNWNMTTQKLFYKNINYLIFGLALAGFILSGGIAADRCDAEGRYYKEEWKLPGFYPQGFDGYGHIDRLDMDEVVIDDSLLKLDYNVSYNTPRSKNTSDSDFLVGAVVGYLLNSEGKVVSLWLIK